MANLFRYTLNIFRKDKRTFLMSFVGLVVAFTVVLFVFSWIRFENSFDSHFSNSKRLYRFTVEMNNGTNSNHFARVRRDWIKSIPEYFPEIERMLRMKPGRNSSLKIDENVFNNKNVFSCNSDVFNVFSLNLKYGNKKNALESPFSAVVSESIVKKYFKNTSPIGKKLVCKGQQDKKFKTYTITGVMPDFPENSHLHPQVLLSLEKPDDYTDWYYVYVLLKPNTSIASVKSKIDGFKEKYIQTKNERKFSTFHFQNIRDIHLFSDKDREIERNGNYSSVKVIAILALVLFVVIMLNYVNIQTVTALKRSKTFNTCKVLGAQRRDIFKQISFETIIMSIAASLIAILLYYSALPLFRMHFGTIMFISFKETLIVYLITLVFFLIVGVICGFYPIMLLFRYSGKSFHKVEFTVRRVLMSVQFVSSICLVVFSVVAVMQNKYVMSNRMGSGQSNILNITDMPRSAVDNYLLFKKKLKTYPEILDVTASMEEPSGEVMDAFTYEFDKQKADRSKLIYLLPTDHNFNKFYGNKIIAGNDFFNTTPNTGKYIINRAALKQLGHSSADDIIGKSFKILLPMQDLFVEGVISGVVDNFNISKYDVAEKPLVLSNQPEFCYCVGVKFMPEKLQQVMDAIRGAWRVINPDYDFDYMLIDDLYHKLYINQVKQAKFLQLLTLIVIIISCLGLMGTASFDTQKRTKEIGIRKVNGANRRSILVTLNKDILRWIFPSFLISMPISFYIVDKWLGNFSYKIDVGWYLYIFSGISLIPLSLIIVAMQSWKVASKNPVESLRYE